MADQDRRLVERTNLRLIVVDDLVQAEALELAGCCAQLLDVSPLARPLGRGDLEALVAEVAGEALPALRREPGSVDQHQRSRIGGGFHGETSRWVTPTTLRRRHTSVNPAGAIFTSRTPDGYRFAGSERAYAVPSSTHFASSRSVRTCSTSTRSHPCMERPRISKRRAFVVATSVS